MNNPLGEYSELGRWIFVYDYDDDRGGGFVNGEFLLRSDGSAFRRMGMQSGYQGTQTWRFVTDWTPVEGWERETDIPAAIKALKRGGYGITSKHSNVPVDESDGEPTPTSDVHPTYL